MTKIEMITNLNDFPIGNYPETRKELLSKAEIVAFMSKYLDEFAEIENSEEIIRNYYSNLLELGDIEKIPSIMEALNELRIHPDVVQDFGKIRLSI